MKTVALGLAVSLALCVAPSVASEEAKVDTSQIRIRRAIAEKLTPEELQARKERLAGKIAERRARGLVVSGTGSGLAGDTCPTATPETVTLPFNATGTTVGFLNDYTPGLPGPTVTCSAPTPCEGRPFGRGEVYLGTGWGPDRAYAIRTDANCSLTIDLNPTDTGLIEDDLGLLVYQTQCSNDLIDCACASDNGFPGNPDLNGNTEGVVLDAIAGTNYFIVIDGYSSTLEPPGEEGPFTLSIAGTGCTLVTPPSQYHTITPCRLIDTRNANGAFGGPALDANADRTFDVDAGSCLVPATADSVYLNVTVTQPTVAGNVRLWPAGTPMPLVSTLNYAAAQTRANNGIFGLNANGEFTIRATQASGTAHVIVDVVGYFEE